MTDRRVFGIDLGTTYSCIAHVNEYDQLEVIPNSNNQTVTPSVVYFEGPDQVVVGATAKDAAARFGDRVVTTVKQKMGQEWQFTCDGKEYTPQEISAHILRKLAADAERETGIPVEEVVITCPAYFDFAARAATAQAGAIAGLKVLQVVPEPTAAAFAYGLNMDEEQVILVYDLGGGTFDITMLEIARDGIRQVCVGGDPHLGGTNWDAEVASWLAQQFSDSRGVPMEDLTNRATFQDLLLRAEEAKVKLTDRASYPLQVVIGSNVLETELSREKFDELTANHLEQTFLMTDDLLEEARGRGHDHVDRMLLVGGSTFMPQIKDAVQSRYDFEVISYRPNQAVAEGAALIAHKLMIDDQMSAVVDNWPDLNPEERKEKRKAMGYTLPTQFGNLDNLDVRNVSPRSFGVKVRLEGTNEIVGNNLLLKNEPLPQIGQASYGTADEGQDGVVIECLQNHHPTGPSGHFPYDPEEALGEAVLSFGKPVSQGYEVEVTFELGEDGLLKVHGRDPLTDADVSCEFLTAGVLDVDEEQRAKEQAMTLKVTD